METNPMYCVGAQQPGGEHRWIDVDGLSAGLSALGFCVSCGISFKVWERQTRAMVEQIPLRDFLASAALACFVLEPRTSLINTAEKAYMLADAMLAERLK